MSILSALKTFRNTITGTAPAPRPRNRDRNDWQTQRQAQWQQKVQQHVQKTEEEEEKGDTPPPQKPPEVQRRLFEEALLKELGIKHPGDGYVLDINLAVDKYYDKQQVHLHGNHKLMPPYLRKFVNKVAQQATRNDVVMITGEPAVNEFIQYNAATKQMWIPCPFHVHGYSCCHPIDLWDLLLLIRSSKQVRRQFKKLVAKKKRKHVPEMMECDI